MTNTELRTNDEEQTKTKHCHFSYQPEDTATLGQFSAEQFQTPSSDYHARFLTTL